MHLGFVLKNHVDNGRIDIYSCSTTIDNTVLSGLMVPENGGKRTCDVLSLTGWAVRCQKTGPSAAALHRPDSVNARSGSNSMSGHRHEPAYYQGAGGYDLHLANRADFCADARAL